MEFLFTWGTAVMWILQNFKNTFLKQKWTASFETMFIWIQLNNFPNSSLMTSIIFTHRIGNTYTVKILHFIRSSHPEMFRLATSLKKRLWHRCFPVNFVKFLKHLFLQNPSGGCFCFVVIEFYVFLVQAFQFSKLHENVDKLDRGNFKRGFIMTFMVKNL